MSRVGERIAPWWLERQLDPESPDFQPGGPRDNVTHRDWVQLGTVSTTARAIVDPRGLVTPTDDGWSLDWWIGADDRWHIPSREVAVRQQRLDAAPVIETSMRVPGGDAVHRAYAVQGSTGPLAVVEVENRTSIPFAVGLVVVPYNASSEVGVRTITAHDLVVDVDGQAAVFLPKPPARIAAGCNGRTLTSVMDGLAAVPDRPHTVNCADGRAEAALVFPLAHTAVLRVVMPMHREVRPAELNPSAAATADVVQRGWRTQVDRGPRVDIPDDRLRDAFDAARRDLVLLPAREDVLSWPGTPLPWTTTALVLEALDLLGFHAEVEEVLGGVPDEQRLDGAVVSPDGGLGSNGAVLRSIGLHWQLTRDGALVERLVGPIAKAGHWIEKRRTARRRPLLAEARYLDVFWSIAGLWAVTPALAAVGQPEVAEDLAEFGARLRADVDAAHGADRTRLGFDVAPARPGGAFAVDAVANLEAAWLAEPCADAHLAGLAEVVRTRWMARGLVMDPGGWGLRPGTTIALGMIELLCGVQPAMATLTAVLDHASPVNTWPEVVHPRSGGGSHGSGHDPAAVAALCTFVRTMLVREQSRQLPTDARPGSAQDGLVLCSLVPDAWLGQSWEVHDLPTTVGRLSYAVRWHGERPALLWELEAHDGIDEVTVTAPGLDPGWGSRELRGEALLAPVTPPIVPSAEAGGTEASSSFA
jgi:hypothetical protein